MESYFNLLLALTVLFDRSSTGFNIFSSTLYNIPYSISNEITENILVHVVILLGHREYYNP